MSNMKPNLGWIVFGILLAAPGPLEAAEVRATLRVESPHPWRPPFHLDRVGRPVAVVVETDDPASAPDGFQIVEYHDGRETARRRVDFPAQPPFQARLAIGDEASEVALIAVPGTEAARIEISRPDLDAEAIASPATVLNPVDLGTILPPADWLLLGPGQNGIVEVAALLRNRDEPDARVEVWFASASASGAERRTAPLPLDQGRRATCRLEVPQPAPTADRDVLNVAITAGDGRTLWTRAIPTMRVQKVPERAAFGAYETKLRYDAPISVRDPASGTFSSLDYAEGWDAGLNDVVVNLPNGARFVFWRGSSYIPFWAGRLNTGACYEWAEIISRQPDAVDCVEPLMDKELRYGRVRIIESTPARVHVRWTYQSTDLHYKVWGDQAVEDYYFYPDGFGTRVVNLKTDPATEYELCELIVLTPQAAYPLDVLPENLVDALALDGAKRAYRFPIRGEADAPGGGEPPAVYRLRLNRREQAAAVCFNPGDRAFPPVVFGPFEDRGELVTPCYWGSHWPLARGNATGSKIDERIAESPCHNSVMSWAASRPAPVSESLISGVDAVGKARPLAVRRWAWLIGMTDAPDDRLLQWARSYAQPPALEVLGAQVAFEGWSAERRSFGLTVDGPSIEIAIKPEVPCVNPVFELAGAPGGEPTITLDGVALPKAAYAWDGRTLWVEATLTAPALLKLDFDGPAGEAVPNSVGD